MRKLSIISALLTIVLLVVSWNTGTQQETASAQSGIDVFVHGKRIALSTPALLVKGTTMVPLRQIAEALEAEVEWKTGEQNSRSVTLTRGNKFAVFTMGSTAISVNGRTVMLEAAPLLKGNVTLVPLRALSESLGAVVSWDGLAKTVRIDNPKELPVIGTVTKLKEILGKPESQSRTFQKSVAESAPAADQAAAVEAPADGGSGGDYSGTNVQVEGVDEADWAKTDGSFIYQLSAGRILISDISDPARPKLASTLDYNDGKGFYPQEMYVDKGLLVVIGQHNLILPMPIDPGIGGQVPADAPSGDTEAPQMNAKTSIVRPSAMRSTVKAMVYNVNESGKAELKRETEMEGNYVSSRKIGSALYLVTNKYTNIYPLVKEEQNSGSGDPASFEPLYSDSAVSADTKQIPLGDIRYFPGSPESSMMIVGALDLDRPEQKLQISAYLGSGQTIYASTKNLYVAIPKYEQNGDSFKQQTQVHKFRLDHGNVVYIGEGTVSGTILNQFSMDEHESYFRIATTKGDMWATGDAASKNNVYVLDEQLKTVGTLENLAPGERIYSVRFMGKRAYMVTFRNVDPLFVIDLHNPAKPEVLGQLKIPGYSDYLHPYDDTHIIGFGKETVELPVKGAGSDETTAFYQGMKIALFDVTDVTRPKEMFKEIIGDRGTHSELLYDHKALLFSKAKGLMAFPVDLMQIKDKKEIESGGMPAYGQFTYQGAYVYKVDLQEGFKLRGRITHMTSDELARSGMQGYDYTKSVRRIMYVGDTLYTLSESMLKANDLDSLNERGSLHYPFPPEQMNPAYPSEPGIMVK